MRAVEVVDENIHVSGPEPAERSEPGILIEWVELLVEAL